MAEVKVKIEDVDGEMYSCTFCDNLAVFKFVRQGHCVYACPCHVYSAVLEIFRFRL